MHGRSPEPASTSTGTTHTNAGSYTATRGRFTDADRQLQRRQRHGRSTTIAKANATIVRHAATASPTTACRTPPPARATGVHGETPGRPRPRRPRRTPTPAPTPATPGRSPTSPATTTTPAARSPTSSARPTPRSHVTPLRRHLRRPAAHRHGHRHRRRWARALDRAGPDRHDAHQRRQLHRRRWTFTDADRQLQRRPAARSIDSIAKANATIMVTGYSVTYDGLPHTATGSATGVIGESLQPASTSPARRTPTPAPTPATPGRSPTPPATTTTTSGTVDRQHRQGRRHDLRHAATTSPTTACRTPPPARPRRRRRDLIGRARPVGHDPHQRRQLHRRRWTFTDAPATTTTPAARSIDSIAKANATIVVTGYSVTYDGLPHTATGSATGVTRRAPAPAST